MPLQIRSYTSTQIPKATKNIEIKILQPINSSVWQSLETVLQKKGRMGSEPSCLYFSPFRTHLDLKVHKGPTVMGSSLSPRGPH